MEIDDRLRLATPEGLDVDLVVVGLGSRFVAFLIDTLIVIVLLIVLGVLNAFGNLGIAGFLISSFLVTIGYPILFEAFNNGRTPGKALTGIQVVMDDGRPVTFMAAVIRNILRPIDSLPTGYLVAIISIVVSTRHQRIGDFAAGTLVVRREPSVAGRSGFPATGMGVGPGQLMPGPAGAPGLLGWLPPEAASWDVSAVTGEEVGAARSFLERRGELTPEARSQIGTELANRIRLKVAGVPVHEGPERFLELVVTAKLTR